MIDLSSHLSAAEQKHIGPLFMSDRAAEELGMILAALHAGQSSTQGDFAPIVTSSVAGFLTSDYFKRSAWFRRQRVHTTAICSIPTSDGPNTPVFHVLKSDPRGYCVVSPDECPLPDAYFDERVIEEVRIECGITESTEPTKRGRMP